MIKQFFEISPGIYNVWLFSLTFFVINQGLIFLFPKHNIKKFIEIPFSGSYVLINKVSFYLFFICSIFIPLKTDYFLFIVGVILFFAGIILYAISFFYFAISEYDKPVTEGIYKISRHPVYLSFFVVISGMILVSLSGILFIIAIFHVYSLFFLINKEEEFCEKKYGNIYLQYKNKTRKII